MGCVIPTVFVYILSHENYIYETILINYRNLAVTELWEITEDDEPKLFDGIGVNPYRSPYVKSRDYQFGIALYKINSNTTELPNKCAKSN